MLSCSIFAVFIAAFRFGGLTLLAFSSAHLFRCVDASADGAVYDVFAPAACC
jgi:hypothetical protein